MKPSTLDQDFLARLDEYVRRCRREFLSGRNACVEIREDLCFSVMRPEEPCDAEQPDQTERAEEPRDGARLKRADALPDGETRMLAAALRAPLRNVGAELAGMDGLTGRLRQKEESFSTLLIRMIRASGMSNAQCYARAHVSRQHFSKILSNPDYRPTKETAIAFAIALELDREGADRLLNAAGYALSHSQTRDIIVAFFIEMKRYSIMEINEALLRYEQPLLCA